MKEDRKIEKGKRKRIREIVKTYSMNNAVKFLMKEGFCVAKSQAKRTYIQFIDSCKG